MKKPLTLLGNRIKKLLGKRTQGWLAGELDVTDQALSKWMYGKSEPTLSNLRQLAKVLECSIGHLAGDEEDDDTAAIAQIASQMDEDTRRFYRKSGSSLIQTGDNEPLAIRTKPKERNQKVA